MYDTTDMNSTKTHSNSMKATVQDEATVAYIVRKTYFDRTPHEDVARFDVETAFLSGRASVTYAYSDALEKAQAVRRESHNGYAVIDRIKANGERVQG